MKSEAPQQKGKIISFFQNGALSTLLFVNLFHRNVWNETKRTCTLSPGKDRFRSSDLPRRQHEDMKTYGQHNYPRYLPIVRDW